ncbi:acyl-CoA reductase [Eubacterium barkeri]|uniref:Acyl-CoA reductase (LuxC) n=1 Tax=Eubacterium barkeri TaxID=1528 RepID=A0A1H3K206_EUBBA|nr:acyl-CoA reductase [Eubacterium barkeri]SDY45638.1 Acyl-CoA reductase (LuxC) [Eubacterium barkeri]
MNINKINYLVGNQHIRSICAPIFSDRACGFLNRLALALKNEPRIKEKKAAVAFAFWCRPANLKELKNRYTQWGIGRGLVFHISPANIPLFFLYTLAVGLLAGNSNVIRLSERISSDDRVACNVLNQILSEDEYKIIAQRISILTYPKEELELTKVLSRRCEARIIWGGDQSIETIRAFPLSPQALDLSFPNRVSLALISDQIVADLDLIQMEQLARRFCNDTYAMDQRACSSPRLVLWYGDKDNTHRQRFWNAVKKCACDFGSEDIYACMARYTYACCFSAKSKEIRRIKMDIDGICRLQVDEPVVDWDVGEVGFGTFIESSISELDEVFQWDTPKLQTVTVYGIDTLEVSKMILKTGMRGGSRVVPIGCALDFNVVWDGIDLILALSRTWGKEINLDII